jgi:ABC-type multidrug transport system ATPase subunit
MGASASGKSLFMQVLAGRIQDLNVTGNFLIEGMPVDHKDLSNKVAYVPQDDILIGNKVTI